MSGWKRLAISRSQSAEHLPSRRADGRSRAKKILHGLEIRNLCDGVPMDCQIVPHLSGSDRFG